MADRLDNLRFDARSPVQPGPSPAPYFIFAVLAAVAIWALPHLRIGNSNSPIASSERAATQARRAARPGEARGDLRTLFTADDYPAGALNNGEEGTVQAKLTVDPGGRVSQCTVLRSSGHSSLDGATYSILQRRARFTPAHDAAGHAIASNVTTPPIKWVLES